MAQRIDIAGAEQAIRARIRFELAQRGWSQESFAARVTNAGVPMSRQAVKTLLKEQDPRRVKVEELLAISLVFGTNVDEMWRPLDAVVDVHIERLSDKGREAAQKVDEAWDALVTAWLNIRTLGGRRAFTLAAKRGLSIPLQGMVPLFEVKDDRVSAAERGSQEHQAALGALRVAVNGVLNTLVMGPSASEDPDHG